MNLLLRSWIVLALVCSVSLAAEPRDEVDVEAVLRMGDTCQLVGDGTRSATDDIYDVMGPPASDNHKWFITVVSIPNCPACTRLKADLVRDPHLAAFVNVRDQKASWAHYNEYLHRDKSQAWRFANVQFKAFPTILIQPPLNKQYGEPSTIVDQITGYDGDGKKLAARLRDSIALYARKLRETHQGGHQQVLADGEAHIGQAEGLIEQAPWTPRPKQDQPPEPGPYAPYAPYAPPQIPVFPFDQPPTPDAPAIPDIPKTPQVVLITDGSERAEELGPLEKLVQRLRDRERLRFRELNYEDVKDQYPVEEGDLPAVFVTRDGQIEAKILSRLLPSLEPPVPTPATRVVEVEKIVEVPKEVTYPDVPWDVFLGIFTTGFTPAALIALGVYLFRLWRAHRKATGGAVLVSDDSLIDRLLERGLPRLETLIERIAERRAQRQGDPPPVDPAK